MAITINGSGITSSEIADSAITSTKIADGTITNADINSSAAIAQSKTASLVSGDLPTGSVVQFVSKNLSHTWSTTSTTYVTTDLTIDFTPKFANSTILVQFFGSTHFEASNHGKGQIRKDGATISNYAEDDLLAYLNTTDKRGQLEGGFWAGDAGSTLPATYAYYVKSNTGDPFYFYRNSGISVTEIRG